MNPSNAEAVVRILTYLLPGFITAEIVYNLTPTSRPTPFERVVQALIFTVLIQVALFGLESTFSYAGRHGLILGVWTENVRLTWSVLVAFVLGLIVAKVSNHDSIHQILRRSKFTHQTSYCSEWYGVFAQNNGYVVLHLSGSRRLYGWPEEWPSTPDKGHFVMSQAEWLDGNNRIPLTGVERILISVSEVQMVEFMGTVNGRTGEDGHGRSEGTNTAADTAKRL